MFYAIFGHIFYINYGGFDMSKHISTSAEEIWNTRLKAEMDKRKISQRKFAQAYTSKFGIEVLPDGKKKKKTTSQADVSRWQHVGDKDEKTGKPRGFPDYKTMRNIASLLNVSVSYLTGETDCESFDLEKASNYVGLTPSAIKTIRRITKPTRIPITVAPFYFLHNDVRKEVIEILIASHAFGDYLNNLHDFIMDLRQERNSNSNSIQFVIDRIPQEYRDNAVKTFIAIERSDEVSLQEMPKELRNYVELLELARDWELAYDSSVELKAKVSEYTVVQSHAVLLNEIKKAIDCETASNSK